MCVSHMSIQESYRITADARERVGRVRIDNAMLDAAIDATRHGWAVSPSIPGTKRALLRWGTEADWCNDPDEVASRYGRYWRRRSNPLVICGPSGLLIVDLDVKHGLDGPGEFTAIMAK